MLRDVPLNPRRFRFFSLSNRFVPLFFFDLSKALISSLPVTLLDVSFEYPLTSSLVGSSPNVSLLVPG